MLMIFHPDGVVPTAADNTIFVFGSNLAGRHGKGAALVARQRFGAQYGIGVGRTGNAYAIPTKGYNLNVLPIADVREYISQFLEYAHEHPELRFFVTRIGCGLAGFRDAEIAPLFAGAPDNCSFAVDWQIFIGMREKSILQPGDDVKSKTETKCRQHRQNTSSNT